jgi:hypothetical protein
MWPPVTDSRLVLSDFDVDPEQFAPGVRWSGFTDRVMGGVSDATLERATVAGRRCIRLAGRVTRDRGGGFIQAALDLAPRGGVLDGSPWRGVELDLCGNDEDYNVHLRTPDCRWYDESYRCTFRATPEWRRLRIPWRDFKPNGLGAPLATARLQRVALLGWMREFEADVALASIALYSA